MCVCLLVCVSPYQEKAYDPDGEWESDVAKELQLPWDLRGPVDGRPVWKKQAYRPNTGRYANRGGWAKRVATIYKASGRDVWFSSKNPYGPLIVCKQHSCVREFIQRRGNNRAYMQHSCI